MARILANEKADTLAPSKFGVATFTEATGASGCGVGAAVTFGASVASVVFTVV
ncbi:hypothetical protein [Flavobacterium faecale]|uniref:hypothetical protein n=1 Tax=Flavobacterium faecale TaxID=1355330 RepID=UPI00131EF711|nr:hypothetical protein [Flavobacterium faecale]